nr:MAG TPA: hypothetical protein [Bacteriophage sp.]
MQYAEKVATPCPLYLSNHLDATPVCHSAYTISV